jgi:microcystin-dependent protein
MSMPFLGEVRMFSFGFAPKGWAMCNGQLLPINQNQALFSLLGTVYGGDGITTFQLPNLQASMPIHEGNGFALGARSGESTHVLIESEIPAHNHLAQGVSTTASLPSATGAAWAASTMNPYATTSDAAMAPNTVTGGGGGQPHDNMPPYLTLNICISLTGIFPSRN